MKEKAKGRWRAKQNVQILCNKILVYEKLLTFENFISLPSEKEQSPGLILAECYREIDSPLTQN